MLCFKGSDADSSPEITLSVYRSISLFLSVENILAHVILCTVQTYKLTVILIVILCDCLQTRVTHVSRLMYIRK